MSTGDDPTAHPAPAVPAGDVLDAHPDLIVLVDRDGRIRFANRAAADALGRSVATLLTLGIHDLNAAVDAAAWSAVWARLQRGGRFHVRSAWRRADGAAIDVVLRSELVHLGGTPLAYTVAAPATDAEPGLSTAADRLALERLAEVEQIYNGAPIGLCLTDRQHRYVRINERMAQINGRAVADHIGRTLDDIVPELAPRLRKLFHPVLERGESLLDVEIHGRTHAGEHDWLASYLPFQSPGGEIIGVLAAVADVTHLKDVERRLAESEALMRRAQEVAHVGSWSWDVVRRRARWNRELYRICGLPAPDGPEGETDAGTFLALVHPEDRARVIAAVRVAVEGMSRLRIEYRVVRPDGAIRWIYGDADLERDEHGAPLRLLGIGQDITERREAEEARRAIEMKMLQAQKLESLGVLAGGIAHDFNNLLVGVLGNAGLAMGELPEGSPLQQPVARIEQAALRAADLVRQMLAYSGRGQFIVGPVDLNAVIREMTHLLATVLSKKATVCYELAPEGPSVHADATQIRQVVMNLITNASDALGDEPGTITVATGVTDATGVMAATAGIDVSIGREDLPPGRYAFVRVTDSGSGIAPDMLGRIFDPFFSTKFTGRGLGLAAVQGIVRAHRGGIHVRSEPARGSTFTVLLPLLDADRCASAIAAAAETVAAVPAGLVVLVVDDEPDVRETARTILHRQGYVVFEAADGREALLKLTTLPRIDVVLLDLTMPHLSGVETLAEIRRRRPSLPVLLSSGYGEQDVMRQCADSAHTSFVQKPYGPAGLLMSIARAISGGMTTE